MSWHFHSSMMEMKCGSHSAIQRSDQSRVWYLMFIRPWCEIDSLFTLYSFEIQRSGQCIRQTEKRCQCGQWARQRLIWLHSLCCWVLVVLAADVVRSNLLNIPVSSLKHRTGESRVLWIISVSLLSAAIGNLSVSSIPVEQTSWYTSLFSLNSQCWFSWLDWRSPSLHWVECSYSDTIDGQRWESWRNKVEWPRTSLYYKIRRCIVERGLSIHKSVQDMWVL